MAKKDYVLEKAIKGDMDALENILGGLLSPLFDLAFHFYHDVEKSTTIVDAVLRQVAKLVLANDLGGQKPLQVAAEIQCQMLSTNQEERGEWHPFLNALTDQSFIVFLAHFSLDSKDSELDRLLQLEDGAGKSLLRESLEQEAASAHDWRDIFDGHALEAKLPTGLVDRIVTEIEDAA